MKNAWEHNQDEIKPVKCEWCGKQPETLYIYEQNWIACQECLEKEEVYDDETLTLSERNRL